MMTLPPQPAPPPAPAAVPLKHTPHWQLYDLQKRIGAVRDVLDRFDDRSAEAHELNAVSRDLEELIGKVHAIEQRAADHGSIADRLAACHFRVIRGNWLGYGVIVRRMLNPHCVLADVEMSDGMSNGVPREAWRRDEPFDPGDLKAMEGE
jgi:hypothetical protein